MAELLIALWQEAEEHLQAFQQYARRTVEEAWLAGDALMRIKEQLPHGGWRSGLEERGITKSTAHRFISLRKKYPQMSQVGTFSSVSAALTAKPRNSELETRNSNTDPQDQPPAQPQLLEELQEDPETRHKLQEPSAQAEAHDELSEPPEPHEQPQVPPQAFKQPSAQPQPLEEPQEDPETRHKLQEPSAQAEAHDELSEPPEAFEQPSAQLEQSPPAAQAQEQPAPSPGTRSSSSEFRVPSSGRSVVPPFRRRPPFPAPGPRSSTQLQPQEKALPVPADAHTGQQRRMQLRLRTPRLLLPGSHTAFRLGLSCFVDVDDAAENKNAAPDQERQSNNPDAGTMSGRKA